MKIKALNNTKDIIAMKLEYDGVYVTEDIDGNICAVSRDSNGNCQYTCIYGSTYFIFNEQEIITFYNAVKRMAIENGDDINGTGITVTDGWAYNKYKDHSRQQILGTVIDRMLLGGIKLYCTKRKGLKFYFLEKGGRRIGGTIKDWNKTVDDLNELKEYFGIWERSM